VAYRRGQFSRETRVTGVVLLVLVVLLGGAWYWFATRDGESGPVDGPAAADTAERAAAPDSAIDLPSLSASDEFVRRAAAELSARPRLAEWLATDSLVRSFVGAVVKVSAGLSPRDELDFMEPEGSFGVREPDPGAVVIDTASYDRYDPIVATFVSLDTDGTAELYRRLRPLFQEAYRDFGFQNSFDGALAGAVETLLAVPVPQGPVELVPAGVRGYEYRDPELEGLSPAQKHLLRMGPRNIERVQAKLRRLVEALELPVLPARLDAQEADP
jgi:hypothetical protein